MRGKTALVIFGKETPPIRMGQYDAVISGAELDELVCPGSIYEATAMLEKLPHLKLADGALVSKSFLYKGYELWWMHYDSLYFHFCLPYTRYRLLLERLQEYKQVDIYAPPYATLFEGYLGAHDIAVRVLGDSGRRVIPFGVLWQIILTLLSLPAAALQRKHVMVFTGDKFEKGKDHDFRLRFIYEELRRRHIPFIEIIRGIGGWRTVLDHAWIRRRPVIYADAALFAGRFISVISGGRSRMRRRFAPHITPEATPEARFKLWLATIYLCGVSEDIWAIRIMRVLLRIIGVKAAYVTVALERNFSTVLACKLNNIPTVGILHGVASRYYNVYEFMPGFTGEKKLSVDRYGVWSEWWRKHFIEHSRAYAPEQLYVSGLMRPLLKGEGAPPAPREGGTVSILFVSEVVAVPEEVLPYLKELLRHDDIKVTLKFRSTNDSFEEWLKRHEPQLLERVSIEKGTMQEALARVHAAVGCQSTGVLEALQQGKVPIYFRTRKWGDYYELKGYEHNAFFAETPGELVERIRSLRTVSPRTLQDLGERYFGDSYQNGSAWVVEQLEQFLSS